MAAQQLNLADRLAVRVVVLPRITAAVANFALYVIGGGGVSPADPTNAVTWARQALTQVGSAAEQVSWYVLNQDGFLDAGSSIADGDLKGIVEFAIKTYFIPPAA